MRLLLHLDCVPLVYLCKFDRFDAKGVKVPIPPARVRQSLGDRRTHWKFRGRKESNVRGEIDDYVESSYMMLEFMKSSVSFGSFSGKPTRPQHEVYVNILARLYSATAKPVLFRSLDYKGGSQCVGKPLFDFPVQKFDGNFLAEINNDFDILYMIEALKSRGFHFKDQLLMDKDQVKKFKHRIQSLYHQQYQVGLVLFDGLTKQKSVLFY